MKLKLTNRMSKVKIFRTIGERENQQPFNILSEFKSFDFNFKKSA